MGNLDQPLTRSDVLITSADGSRVFLGKRKALPAARVHPQPDWHLGLFKTLHGFIHRKFQAPLVGFFRWGFGGRAKPGESPQEAVRLVRFLGKMQGE